MTLENVKIEYSNLEKIKVGVLHNSEKYKFKLSESANEKAISVSYSDRQNKNYKDLVIPYLILAQRKNYVYEIK